ncbi:MAG: DUF4331 family protein [Alteraurantiacibacter sp.]
MTYFKTPSLRRMAMLAPLSLAIALGGCFDDDDDDEDVVVAPPTETPAPTPTPTTASFDVSPCLQQAIPGTGLTVAGAVVPDTLTLNLSADAGFPNGRLLTDPVIDVTLAVIFLDLDTHSPLTFAGIPLNPPANDRPFRDGFPFLAPPQGSPPIATGNGSNFTFRTATRDQYVRVDRMGMPAVATALIGTDQKVPYNDASPQVDVQNTFVPELVEQLTGLTNALADDLVEAQLTPCAVES